MNKKEVKIAYDASPEDFYFAVHSILESLGVEYDESGEETITITYEVP